jgi:undecaprenyl-diphosphatase
MTISWQQDAGALLWSVGGALLLLALGGAFLYVLTRRAAALARPFRRADDWLLVHLPRFWKPLRTRIAQGAARKLAGLGGFVLFIGAVYVFAEIADSWMSRETLYRIDQGVQAALARGVSDAVLRFMHATTYLGDVLMVLVVGGATGVYLWRRRAYRLLVSLVLALGGGQAVVFALKWAFARSRPHGGLTDPVGSSFPSGHTFTATVLWGFLIVLAWRFVDSRSLRLAAVCALTAFMFTAGVSRVVLGVHWVSDVFGGWSIGLAWLTCVLLTTRMWGSAKLLSH